MKRTNTMTFIGSFTIPKETYDWSRRLISRNSRLFEHAIALWLGINYESCSVLSYNYNHSVQRLNLA